MYGGGISDCISEVKNVVRYTVHHTCLGRLYKNTKHEREREREGERERGGGGGEEKKIRSSKNTHTHGCVTVRE